MFDDYDEDEDLTPEQEDSMEEWDENRRRKLAESLEY